MMNKTIGILVALLVVLAVAVYMNAQRRDSMAWPDGAYTGRSQADEQAAYGSVDIEIKEGRISEVKYEEFNGDGSKKDESYPYQPAISAQRTLEKNLVQTQDPDQVDNVSGATATWEKFKEASKDALAKAK